MSAFTVPPSFVLPGLAGGFAIGLIGIGGGATLTAVEGGSLLSTAG